MSLLTVREIKKRTEAFFESKGVPNARLDTDTLIAHVLGIKRLELYLDMDRPLTEVQLTALRPLVRRRANREPLQYIVGTVDFFAMELKVDSRALIPRQETEELIGHIVSELSEQPSKILDLGTGAGAIALALANKYPDASVDAVDVSAAALALAKENARSLELEPHICFHQGSWFEPLGAENSQYDLIVSNPPYLTEQEIKTAEPEVTQYEPHNALVAGEDGLDAIRLIFKQAGKFLAPGALLALEAGIEHRDELVALGRSIGLKGECLNDLSDRPRFYLARKQ